MNGRNEVVRNENETDVVCSVHWVRLISTIHSFNMFQVKDEVGIFDVAILQKWWLVCSNRFLWQTDNADPKLTLIEQIAIWLLRIL